MSNAFIQLAAQALQREHFTVVDIGCSGGIEPAWRDFGDRLVAIGFDASISECRRLSEAETHPGVRYVPGFVDIPPDHSFAKRAEGKPVHLDRTFDRFSAAWTMEIRSNSLRTASEKERFAHNMWESTELADRSKPIFAPQVLSELGRSDIDMIKIDVDGPDFRILNSFDGMFEKLGVLALRLEVCMFGDVDDTTHSFHNTDRFMRRHGYALVGLDPRTYSMRALPARYTTTDPAQTLTGRLFLADAFYARDPADKSAGDSAAAALSDEKLIKLAAVFSAWNHPDAAAELLLLFRARLEPQLDVEKALDVLAEQTQGETAAPLSYRDYMASFAADSPTFYLQRYVPARRPTLAERLWAAWHSVSDWQYIEAVKRRRR